MSSVVRKPLLIHPPYLPDHPVSVRWKSLPASIRAWAYLHHVPAGRTAYKVEQVGSPRDLPGFDPQNFDLADFHLATEMNGCAFVFPGPEYSGFAQLWVYGSGAVVGVRDSKEAARHRDPQEPDKRRKPVAEALSKNAWQVRFVEPPVGAPYDPKVDRLPYFLSYKKDKETGLWQLREAKWRSMEGQAEVLAAGQGNWIPPFVLPGAPPQVGQFAWPEEAAEPAGVASRVREHSLARESAGPETVSIGLPAAPWALAGA